MPEPKDWTIRRKSCAARGLERFLVGHLVLLDRLEQGLIEGLPPVEYPPSVIAVGIWPVWSGAMMKSLMRPVTIMTSQTATGPKCHTLSA